MKLPIIICLFNTLFDAIEVIFSFTFVSPYSWKDSSVLITKRIERVEKPERPRHERTRPKPRKVARAFIEEPDEIEYIQRRSGRNRKQISYKFEEFDSAINTAIHDEVEEKRKGNSFASFFFVCMYVWLYVNSILRHARSTFFRVFLLS